MFQKLLFFSKVNGTKKNPRKSLKKNVDDEILNDKQATVKSKRKNQSNEDEKQPSSKKTFLTNYFFINNSIINSLSFMNYMMAVIINLEMLRVN